MSTAPIRTAPLYVTLNTAILTAHFFSILSNVKLMLCCMVCWTALKVILRKSSGFTAAYAAVKFMWVVHEETSTLHELASYRPDLRK